MATKVISSFKFPEFQYACVGSNDDEFYSKLFDSKEGAAENDEVEGIVATYKLVSVELAKKVPKQYRYTPASNGK